MHAFISYVSEQSELAREIALALRGEGHDVFLDRSQLPEGDAYNARIRQAIRDCDLLVFLVSPEALSAGRYTLTELKFAEEKWTASSKAPTRRAFSPPCHRQIIWRPSRWLYPEQTVPKAKRPLYQYMLAELQEQAGDRAAALATYRALLETLRAEGVAGGHMLDDARRAVTRLGRE